MITIIRKRGVTLPLYQLFLNLLRTILIITGIIALSNGVDAQTYTTTGASNDWNNPAAWTCQGGGCKPTPEDKVTGGAKVIINDSINFTGTLLQVINAQITIKPNAKLVIDQADFFIENNKNKGSFSSDHGSLIISGGTFENRGIVDLIKSYFEINGGVLNANALALDSSCIQVNTGNFLNQAALTGNASNIKAVSGAINNTGTWAAGIAYCANGNLIGNFPGSEDCAAVTLNCDCLRAPCTIPNPDIIPGINSVLRVDSIIGSELTALNIGLTQDSLKNDIFVLGDDSDVCIDIFHIDSAAVTNLLESDFGINASSYQPGSNQLQITVFFPINRLHELNRHSDIIRFVRPTPVGKNNSNSSLDNQGDFAQESFFTRGGFGLTGKGIKIGVISDSYNQSVGNQAASVDVAGGVLPGDTTVGSTNPYPVNVLLDYPGNALDEGRGMLQIVHSVAPQAELYFHTAFISPQSFADGIYALKNVGCDIIVDDITYITESFFGTGRVAQAVSDVTADGVEYFTSAGNFASRAYAATFAATNGNKHNFSGTGDYLQELTLGPGKYLLVLQWDEAFYSAGDPLGAQMDLDFYLSDVNGNPIYGFNRNNIGGDPVEVMPFTVVSNTPTKTNLFIEQVSGPSANGINLKYVIFRAGGTNNTGFSAEYYTGGSTIVGHANHPDAITVGAVRYSNSPTFGGTLVTEAFSSTGEGNKPNFTAPDGANVTVNLGKDIVEDADSLSNFFGTSAAAPHAAGVAALLKESQSKFGVAFNIREKLDSTAIDYFEPPSRMGAGFISAFAATSSFANPSPVITKLNTDQLGSNPGEGGVLVVEGAYLTSQTVVYFRDSILPWTSSTDTSITVEIPSYIGNPAIWIYNPPLANGDGGTDTAYIDDPIITPVIISTLSETKKYGEAIPALTFTTDNASLNQNPVLFDLLAQAITITTVATDTSSIGQYAVVASLDLNLLDPALLELYSFSIGPFGFLKIEPIELLIQPDDITVVYGDPLPQITYQYEFGNGLNIPNKTLIQNLLGSDHQASIANVIAVLSNISLANISLANISLANRAFIASYRNISLANISLANGMEVVEIDARHFEETATSNFDSGTDLIGNISLANFISLANRAAYANTFDPMGLPEPPSLNISLANISLANISLANNFSQLEDALENISLANISLANFISLANISLANFISLANISLANISLANGTFDFDEPMVNFISLANSDNTGIITIIDSADIDAATDIAIPLVPINFITSLDAGDQKIVPAALFSNQFSKNFIVNYAPANLIILPAPLTVEIHDASSTYGDTLPDFITTTTGLKYDDTEADIFDGFSVANYQGSAGSYEVEANLLVNPNYVVTLITDTLTVDKASLAATANPQTKVYGENNPPLTISYLGFVNGDTESVIDTTPVATTTAQQSSDVGTYPIALSGGSDNNYHLILVNGTYTINPRTVTLTIHDKVMIKGQSLPVFTATVTGQTASQSPSEIYTSLSAPDYNGSAGVYSILAAGLGNTNYSVTVIPGFLYVNPVVECSEKIQATDMCKKVIDETIGTITYTRLLRITYENPNQTPIYIALGSNNNYKTKGNTAYLGNPPTVFLPGTHVFEVRTNGEDLQWEVKSPGCNNFSKSLNGSNANTCVETSTAADIGINPQSLATNLEIRAYPNPFKERFILEIPDEFSTASGEDLEIRIFDALGRSIQVVLSETIHTQRYEVDMSKLQQGIYFVNVTNGQENRIFKVIKE